MNRKLMCEPFPLTINMLKQLLSFKTTSKRNHILVKLKPKSGMPSKVCPKRDEFLSVCFAFQTRHGGAIASSVTI